MKAYRTIDKNGKTESYYIVCHNTDNKFQLVSIPWKRIDYRLYETEEEAIEDLKKIVFNARESIVEQVETYFAPVAQLGEHLPYKQKVVGAEPTGCTNMEW